MTIYLSKCRLRRQKTNFHKIAGENNTMSNKHKKLERNTKFDGDAL
jgi:hypothetical protein